MAFEIKREITGNPAPGFASPYRNCVGLVGEKSHGQIYVNTNSSHLVFRPKLIKYKCAVVVAKGKATLFVQEVVYS